MPAEALRTQLQPQTRPSTTFLPSRTPPLPRQRRPRRASNSPAMKRRLRRLQTADNSTASAQSIAIDNWEYSPAPPSVEFHRVPVEVFLVFPRKEAATPQDPDTH